MAESNIILQDYKFDKKGRDIILEMRGKPLSFMNNLLQFIKLDTQVHFIVTRRNIRFRFVNLGGQTTITCPLDTITAMQGGIEKPKWALFSGGLILAISLFLLISGYDLFQSILGLAIGIGLLAFFWINKSLYIGFSTGDFVQTHGLGFEASLPNGNVMTVEEVLNIIEYINLTILKTHSISSVNAIADDGEIDEDQLIDYAKSKNLMVEGENEDNSQEIKTASFRELVEDVKETEQVKQSQEEIDTISDNITIPDLTKLYNSAKQKYDEQDYLAVIDIATEILTYRPKNMHVLRLRSRAYNQIGDNKNAIADRKAWEVLNSKAKET